MNFNTIPEALQDLKQGKIILVTDDPDRENEGDFICAAEFATTENINFMATHGKGLICMPMSEAFVQKLKFRRWFGITRTTMKPPLPCPSTIFQPRPAFLLRNALLPRWPV